MNHPAELTLAQYMTDAANGKAVMSDATIEKIGKDVMDALKRQFGGGTKRKDFALRMSNVGRPSCQLWFQKNRPKEAAPLPSNFVMNMMLGDIVEAIFKGLLTEAKVAFEDADHVALEIPEADVTINGTYDIAIDGRDELDAEVCVSRISKSNNNPIVIATSNTTTLSTLYSFEIKAIAPSFMAFPINCTSLFPSSCLIILYERKAAKIIPIIGINGNNGVLNPYSTVDA